MKEIICPYTWFCGEKIEANKLSEKDIERLEAGEKQNRTNLFICCPICLTEFQFNPVEWKSKAMFSNPNIKTTKEDNTIKELFEILEKSNIKIPKSYLDYLTSEKFDPQVSVIQKQDKFHLYSLEKLCETVNIDDYSCLRIAELKSYAKSLESIFEEEMPEEFCLLELSNCLTIGYENEAILFLDYRDNNSLWIFHPDGGDVESTKMTLEKITKRK